MTGAPPATASEERARGAGTAGGGMATEKARASATSRCRTACSTTAVSLTTSAGPPRMTEKGAPLAERQEHRTASLPGGRYGGTRSGAAVHVRRAARTSTTSTALIASPRYPRRLLSTAVGDAASSNRTSAAGASSLSATHPGTAAAMPLEVSSSRPSSTCIGPGSGMVELSGHSAESEDSSCGSTGGCALPFLSPRHCILSACVAR
mmetsp:Transcript_3031/g.8854  ORF Transcript_3031/g.8854 Transcript_3031/m.8854 type:complete len:207 (+) Transcript_3031:146-766(+)